MFDAQAADLKVHNFVYNESYEHRADLVAALVPNPIVPVVSPPVLDTVVAVATDDDGGRVVSSGPADATAADEEGHRRFLIGGSGRRHGRSSGAFATQLVCIPGEMSRF